MCLLGSGAVGADVVFLGLLFESFVFSSAFLGYIWWDSGTLPILKNRKYHVYGKIEN